MANTSILVAFERMWQHIVAKLGDKASKTEAQNYALDAANTVKNDLLNGAGGAYDTLKELGDLIDDNVDAIDALEVVAAGKADKVHEHTVSDITDLTATATELNYMDGVTSNVQSQLDSLESEIGNKANTSDHKIVTYTDLSQIGLTQGSETIASIASALPVGSVLQMWIGLNHNIDIYPNSYGTLIVEKTHNVHVHFTFYNQSATAYCKWMGFYNGSTWSGWKKMLDDTTTASDVGALPTIVATSSSYDMDVILKSGGHYEMYKTNSLTLNTPYKKGLVATSNALILSYAANNMYGMQVAYVSGVGEYTRTLDNGAISDWERVAIDHKWNLLYDSGEISAIANSISNIDVSGYTNIQVLVRIYNDGDSINSRTGSAIFTCENGKSYQFPVWSNMFSKSINTVYTMATFNLVDGWLICPCASRLIGDATTFEDEGGTAGNLDFTGSGMMKCTSPLSTLTISSLDQNSNYYFGMGSRVMVWGWNA